MFLTRKWSTFLTMTVMAGGIWSCGDDKSGGASNRADSTAPATAARGASAVKEEAVSYAAGDKTMNSFVAYNEAIRGPRPVVLVLPEWWGLTEYARMRAKMLAEMGYLAMAVDLYGDGAIAKDPGEAQSAAGPFYGNPQMAKQRIDAAMQKALSLPQADTSKKAVIGYCFGGSMALNYGKMGAPVLGVVSFHGGLEGVPPQKNTLASYLICHGAADNFVPDAQVKAFRRSMDSAGLNYTFKTYEGATHAFTNPDATPKGEKFNMPIRYSAAADTASWNDMKEFFRSINFSPNQTN